MVTVNYICNPYTLNIFSDASTTTIKGITSGCYGAIAINQNNMIDNLCKLSSDSTSNNCEIKALRSALCLADKYKHMYKYINIYADSLVSVDGIRNYIYNWRYDQATNMLYTKTGTPAGNQEVFVECFMILNQIKAVNPNIRIFYQPGHMDPNKTKDRATANTKFKTFNGIKAPIDDNYIRYICLYNNLIDNKTRNYLLASDIAKVNYEDGLSFNPSIVDKFRRGEYNNNG